MPTRGRWLILLFLSAFFCGIYVILFGLLNQILILTASFFLILIPPCLLGSGFFEALGNSRGTSPDPVDVFARAILEALILGVIIIAVALIREPLGMGTLSFPGGVQGIVEIFGNPDENTFILVRILSASAGGLLLLGYITALFRYFRKASGSVPKNDYTTNSRRDG
jgi:hypothetical protein